MPASFPSYSRYPPQLAGPITRRKKEETQIPLPADGFFRESEQKWSEHLLSNILEEVVSVVILRTLKVGLVLDHSSWMELETSVLKQMLFCSRWWNFV